MRREEFYWGRQHWARMHSTWRKFSHRDDARNIRGHGPPVLPVHGGPRARPESNPQNGEAGISDCCCRNHVTVHCRSWGLFCAEADDRPRRKIRAVFCVHGRSDVDHGVSGARAHSSGTQAFDNRCGTARNVGGCSKRRGRVGASCARCGALGIREESDDCPLGATMRYRLCHLHDRRNPARNDLYCSPLYDQ